MLEVKNNIPGLYTVKVSAASFLPAWRDKVGLHPGVSTHLNITLHTLLNAMRVGPLRGGSDDDDWKWTLRSTIPHRTRACQSHWPQKPASIHQMDEPASGTILMVQSTDWLV